jgi:hypothetical protein
MGETVSPGELTSTQAVTFSNVPCHDVLKISSSAGYYQSFRNLRVCQSRLWGRAAGTIVGKIRFQLHFVPGAQQSMAVGVVPENAEASQVPATVSEIMSCGLSLSSSAYGSPEQSYDLMPGVSNTITTNNVSLLAGAPPKMYFFGASDQTGAFTHYLHIFYTLAVEGIGWVTPFLAINAAPVQMVPTSTASGSGTAPGPSHGGGVP